VLGERVAGQQHWLICGTKIISLKVGADATESSTWMWAGNDDFIPFRVFVTLSHSRTYTAAARAISDHTFRLWRSGSLLARSADRPRLGRPTQAKSIALAANGGAALNRTVRKASALLWKREIRRSGGYELKSTVRIVAGSHPEPAEEARFEFGEDSGEWLDQACQANERFFDVH
jgi:hypothetical protein